MTRACLGLALDLSRCHHASEHPSDALAVVCHAGPHVMTHVESADFGKRILPLPEIQGLALLAAGGTHVALVTVLPFWRPRECDFPAAFGEPRLDEGKDVDTIELPLGLHSPHPRMCAASASKVHHGRWAQVSHRCPRAVTIAARRAAASGPAAQRP